MMVHPVLYILGNRLVRVQTVEYSVNNDNVGTANVRLTKDMPSAVVDNSNIGFLDALSKGFQLMKEKFWPIVGSNLVMVFILQIILNVLTMIPYVIGMASIFTSDQVINNSDSDETFSFLGIVMAIIFVFSILVNYILNNIILINNGVIYYSLRENEENNQQQEVVKK